MLLSDHIGVVVVFDDDGDESAVFVVSDSAPLVALACELEQRLEGNVFGLLVDVHAHLLDGYAQVAIREFLRDVPSDRTKHPSLLNYSMEETQSLNHSLEFLWFTTSFKEIHVRYWFSG